jgi:hypothetical protein
MQLRCNYNHDILEVMVCGIWAFFQYLSFHYSSDDVSFELVYVGWDFGDHHFDDSKIIPNL